MFNIFCSNVHHEKNYFIKKLRYFTIINVIVVGEVFYMQQSVLCLVWCEEKKENIEHKD